MENIDSGKNLLNNSKPPKQVVKNTLEIKKHPGKKKNNSNNNFVIGSNNSTQNNVTLKTVPKKAFLYVSRLHPDTTCQNLMNFLKPKFPEIQCASLESKYPDNYSSFKVTINLENNKVAMDSATWPDGAYVSRFFHRRAPLKTDT